MQIHAVPLSRRGPLLSRQRGFSLVVTVSMMVLLAIIAVGLLSLSSVTLRASVAGNAQAEARSNARMAALLAIAQLQELAGADTRVTASAKLLSDSNIEGTGVWRSWEGSTHDGTGEPIPPDYDLKNQAGDPLDDVASGSDGRFLGWLTSTADMQSIAAGQIPGSSNSAGGTRVKMVAEGTLGNSNDGVYLEPSLLTSEEGVTTGAYSWWTTGDNTKAYLNVDSVQENNSIVDWQERLRGSRFPDGSVFGLADLDRLTTEDTFIPSRESLDLVSDTRLSENGFYDVTTTSRGLLTNVNTGGFRKDLTVFSEFYDSHPASDLPLFGVTPGQDLMFSRATASSRPSNALLYHWADYPGAQGGPPWRQTPRVCAWSALANYMTKYRDLTSSSAANLRVDADWGGVTGGSGTGARYRFQEQIRLSPIVSRIQWVYSIGSRAVDNEGAFNPGLVLTPIVTIYNPYNVSLTVSNYSVSMQRVFPLRLSYSIGEDDFTDIELHRIVQDNIVLDLGSNITLGPGENRVYSLTDNNTETNVNNSGRQTMQLSPGYRPNGGAFFPQVDVASAGNGSQSLGQSIEVSSDTNFAITNIQFAESSAGDNRVDVANGSTEESVGLRFNVTSDGVGASAIISLLYGEDEVGGRSVLDELYPPIVEQISQPVGSVQGAGNTPFATTTLVLRGVTPPPADMRFDNIRTKGMLQANPLQFYAETGSANVNTDLTTGSGASHPVHAPYDFIIEEAQGWNDSSVAVQEGPDNSSYFISGNLAANGLTRCVLAEVPTRPLQSLADLQHFDVRNNNQLPPFQFNLIGNSSAHPLFAPTQVTVPTQGNFPDLANDDSFLLNHVLFDDWFMSSVAPDLADFSSSEERSARQVMIDFLNGDQELANRFYRPSRNALEEEPEELADRLLSGTVDDETGLFPFQAMASLLEVEGMFNINSVSVRAWEAVLRRTRDMDVPFLSSGGSVISENSSNAVFARSTIAGDTERNGNSVVNGAGNGNEALVGGFSSLSDSEITSLAEGIVEEVRARGPFLSLSEFVNRQLSSDTNLALGGAIQQAIDNAGSGGGLNAELQALGLEVTQSPPGDPEYKFPQAALGSTLFGVPGWLRQADVLRPLAPIMTARDDTFTIRSYGDSRDAAGNVQATAWCEMVVQRRADYVDSNDDPEVNPFSAQLTSEVNRRFGRRFEILSFRWLNEGEV